MNQASSNRFVPTNARLSGGLKGYVTLSYCELLECFGPPNSKGDEYKVSTEWIIRDAVTGNVFDIYDYKSTSIYDRTLPSVEEFRRMPEYDWHVGGTNVDLAALRAFLSEKLGRLVEQKPLY